MNGPDATPTPEDNWRSSHSSLGEKIKEMAVNTLKHLSNIEEKLNNKIIETTDINKNNTLLKPRNYIKNKEKKMIDWIDKEKTWIPEAIDTGLEIFVPNPVGKILTAVNDHVNFHRQVNLYGINHASYYSRPGRFYNLWKYGLNNNNSYLNYGAYGNYQNMPYYAYSNPNSFIETGPSGKYRFPTRRNTVNKYRVRYYRTYIRKNRFIFLKNKKKYKHKFRKYFNKRNFY